MPLPASLEEFLTAWDAFRAGIGFEEITDTLGIEPHACDGATLAMRIPLAPRLRQAGGMFSATALFGAADVTGTFLAMQALEPGLFPLAVQSSLNFIDNSRSGPAVATARLVRAGRTIVVASVDVADADGKLLATSSFTYVPKPFSPKGD
ncbi:PaaI family thioesterase [Sinomonas sp. ASV486]|uniref:PaaI family thioesterase n=1 Tax=Sinomonas sp. ASV486 TaxID=3051170 RepID=UPI0027DEA88D|nr:PaaI family thioesterase [Sinomonas sp. ASV486]MDQ4491573.1 PaaI family thioesterase [Sinomonas sp. ASV486]